MASQKRQLNTILSQLENSFDRVDEIWLGRKKASVKHDNKLRAQIHPIHVLIEQLFQKVWRLHNETEFELAEWYAIDRKKVFNGKKDVTRVTYCDGEFHYVTNKKETRLMYGYRCNC